MWSKYDVRMWWVSGYNAHPLLDACKDRQRDCSGEQMRLMSLTSYVSVDYRTHWS